MDLKERAIYQLPNGRELVARKNNQNKIVLYNLSGSDSAPYELNEAGRLVFEGQLTAWQVDDLLDTGRFANSELTSALIESAEIPPASRPEDRF